MYSEAYDITEIEEIGLDAKVKAISARYKNIYEIPGVLVSDIVKNKTLKELGVASAPKLMM